MTQRPILAVTGFVTILVCAVCVAVVLQGGSRGFEAQAARNNLKLIQSRLAAAKRESNRIHLEFAAAISDIDYAAGQGVALDRGKAGVLKQAAQFFANVIAAPHDNSAELLAQVGAAESLATALQLLGDLGGAKATYARAAQLGSLAESLSDKPDVVRRDSAKWLNALGCIAVAQQQWTVAEEHFVEAARRLNELREHYPQDPVIQTLLANVLHNQSIVLGRAGGDGRPLLRQSISLLQQARSTPINRLETVQRLADAHATLAELEWRNGQREAAHGTLNDLLQTLRAAGDEVRAADSVERAAAVHRFREGIEIAARNRRLVAESLEHFPNGQSHEPIADDWNWLPQYQNSRCRLSTCSMFDYVLPGEFEKHEAIILSWNRLDWAAAAMLQLIESLHGRIEVIVLVKDSASHREVEQFLTERGLPRDCARILDIETDTPWVRDYGAFVVKRDNGMSLWLDPITVSLAEARNWYRDDQMPTRVASRLGASSGALPIYMEGGAFLSNGAGIGVVSTGLLQPNEDMGLSKIAVTTTLRQYLGVQDVVYLDPLEEELTGHIDWFITFTDRDTVVVGSYDDSSPQAQQLDGHAKRLAELKVDEKPLQVERIPMPPRGADFFGGTYTNVVYANGVLIVPTWPESDPEVEKQALDTYRRLLPDWDVVTIPGHPLVRRNGSLHCITTNVWKIGAN